MSNGPIDVTIGAAGITSPKWLPALYLVSDITGHIAVIGGAVLVLLRIGLAIREWLRK